MKSLIPSPVHSHHGFSFWSVFFSVILLGTVTIALLPAIVSSVGHTHCGPRGGAGGIQKISIAYIAMSSGERPRRINAPTIHEYAVAIAQYGDLNDPEPWLIKSDSRVEEKMGDTKFPSVVADKAMTARSPWTVNPDFKAYPISLAVANNTPPNVKESTPILWTRGLKPDGTWDKENSVFGESHGIILFRDGIVKTYKGDALAENGGALINYKTGQPTKNILEAIHPEANVLESK